MTLRCQCGGAVEIDDASYGDDSAFERYECPSCGRTGTYEFDDVTGGSTSGCVVDDGGVRP